MEPENPHAWWLLAYAADEPREVREALVRVLRLDPNYTNAPKARDMLTRLNEEFPPTPDELADFPELREYMPAPFVMEAESDTDEFEALFGERFDELPPFEETPVAEPHETFEDDIFRPAFEPEPFEVEQEFFVEDEVLTSAGPDPFAAGEVDQETPLPRRQASKPPKPVRITFEDDEAPLDEEALADIEERQARRAGRGARLLLTVLGALVLVGVLAVVLAVLWLTGDRAAEDLGALEVAEVESDAVVTAQNFVQGELQTAVLGTNSRAVIANIDLGNALFVESCGQPDPTLPELVRQGMEIAARQAAVVQDDLDAVGVTVDRCEGEARDVLYRAVVPVETAVQYASGEIDWLAFHAEWQPAE